MASIHSSQHGKPPPEAASPDLRLLTMGELAVILRTSKKAVYAMHARGQLPPVIKIGRRILMPERDLLAWLEKRRVVSPTESRR